MRWRSRFLLPPRPEERYYRIRTAAPRRPGGGGGGGAGGSAEQGRGEGGGVEHLLVWVAASKELDAVGRMVRVRGPI